jgi:cellulose synthase/poly-beta-1,6-N-acetylglucosamine synthase-like glycosyltransferase
MPAATAPASPPIATPAKVEPAPSCSIAKAARRFGDAYPPITHHWRLRAVALVFVATVLIYLPWMLTSLNESALWLAIPFAAANLFSIANCLLNVFNSWWRRVPEPRTLPVGAEPTVGVIIPTCGEAVPMILRTVTSVLEQDWPVDRLVVVVSDDGHDPALEAALADLPVSYHSPPALNAPGRDGAAKSGNLNSALALITTEHPEVHYIETRDADDEMGSYAFLRQVVGQLEADDRLAYVQTIKEAQVSAGDPFNNRESIFYRGMMLARNAANAVFPCGSGVVWRLGALREIGGFPTWNLVEDLQSGVEALRRGWKGCYLPIVGAVGQHSPEDVPNVYKQRGTWAIDTVRLMVWGDLRGLTLRQRAHFMEMLVFYLHAFTVLVYIPSVAMALLGFTPIVANGMDFISHMLPLVLANEAWLLMVNHPYNDRRRRQRQKIRSLWRVRILWTGLAPVFMKAALQAILGGPNRKPVYKVTRKEDDLRWHWRHTLPQTSLVVGVLAVLVYAVPNGTLPRLSLLLGTVYWGGLNIVLLTGFVTRGWHGVRWLRRVARRPVEGVVGKAATPTA